jgi:hypothetical protein
MKYERILIGHTASFDIYLDEFINNYFSNYDTCIYECTDWKGWDHLDNYLKNNKSKHVIIKEVSCIPSEKNSFTKMNKLVSILEQNLNYIIPVHTYTSVTNNASNVFVGGNRLLMNADLALSVDENLNMKFIKDRYSNSSVEIMNIRGYLKSIQRDKSIDKLLNE